MLLIWYNKNKKKTTTVQMVCFPPGTHTLDRQADSFIPRLSTTLSQSKWHL